MEEVDRVGLELVSVKVQPLVRRTAKTLRLDSLPQVGLRLIQLDDRWIID